MTNHQSTENLTSSELLFGFSTGELSPVDVVTNTLDRIEATDEKYNAFLSVDRPGALESAQAAEQRWTQWRATNEPISPQDWQQLPTWGVPVSVKDSVEQEGLPTTYGSAAFRENYQPDAHAVTTLRNAGCVLVGKTNTSEFALSTITANRLGPPTRNPADISRTAGGSSGGAAAAAALNLGNFALGTDSAGSIRIPAAYCGVYGLKPTLGKIPIRQSWRASPIRSHLGPLARTLDDLIYGWRVMTNDNVPIPALAPQAGLRVGLVANDPDHLAVLQDAKPWLQDTGLFHMSSDLIRLPEVPSSNSRDGDWIFAGDHLAAAERLIPNFWQLHAENLTGYAHPIYESGTRVTAWEYRSALDKFERHQQEAQQVFRDVDIILTSTTDEPPVLHDDENPHDLGPRYAMLSYWNFAGNPALVIPITPHTTGHPRSIQIVGPLGSDRMLLQIAQTLNTLPNGILSTHALSQTI